MIDFSGVQPGADALFDKLIIVLIVMFCCGIVGGIISWFLPRFLMLPVIGISVMAGLLGYFKFFYE
ncbi:hypothetical protein BBD42_26960 [Paenibacillus sp. BIHB 4019]|uniref:Uncharacterized protein n=1 Tax=Paenibacillus sp. BIHB 4019 TaxID=1870819 RepID=A0A1B2DPT0_9BACL|nr:hypothetical protein [Paenibacillus sp. BIHB 4019]ANY69724.1 hypothetical protein BBD42_26960 [Paenibacillus sp. BIHB 4019]